MLRPTLACGQERFLTEGSLHRRHMHCFCLFVLETVAGRLLNQEGKNPPHSWLPQLIKGFKSFISGMLGFLGTHLYHRCLSYAISKHHHVIYGGALPLTAASQRNSGEITATFRAISGRPSHWINNTSHSRWSPDLRSPGNNTARSPLSSRVEV